MHTHKCTRTKKTDPGRERCRVVRFQTCVGTGYFSASSCNDLSEVTCMHATDTHEPKVGANEELVDENVKEQLGYGLQNCAEIVCDASTMSHIVWPDVTKFMRWKFEATTWNKRVSLQSTLMKGIAVTTKVSCECV